MAPAWQLQLKRVHRVLTKICRTARLQKNGSYNFRSEVICIASEGPVAPTCFESTTENWS
ncbi:hypothetical protein DPMN_018931 [Dreissena polymorpha]|uniref:Uncharacterized protein n=1 Tax=Dreissena polymorpha TaxID=45954 RepID=A0A9D4NE37_DREPO|nr:hypothetical protein DPMN_080758 [Dreissena polymorpha]KAH3894772.1 hypothetical protein DPMN_018931 [Dreissena polymorpha]